MALRHVTSPEDTQHGLTRLPMESDLALYASDSRLTGEKHSRYLFWFLTEARRSNVMHGTVFDSAKAAGSMLEPRRLSWFVGNYLGRGSSFA